MFTCFDDYMFTCLHALMIGLNALMITCFYVYMPSWSFASMFMCLDEHMLPCLHALTITCPYACVLSCSFVWSFDDHMLTCMYALMLKCSYMLGLSIEYMEDRIHAHSWMLTRSHALMISRSKTHILFWLYATMQHVLKITFSHAHIHWYSHVWYPHTCTQLVDDMSPCLAA